MRQSTGAFVFACALLLACNKSPSSNPNGLAGAGSGGVGVGIAGTTVPVAGIGGGIAGTTAGTDVGTTAGTGVAGTTAGTTAGTAVGAGAGGTTAGTAAGDGGAGGAAGTAAGAGGTGGTGGTGGGSCESDVTTGDPTTSMACATCMCSMCNAEITAVNGDPLAAALAVCGKKKDCQGDCCFCNDNHICHTMDCGNYGGGPCADETAKAAGFAVPQTMTTCYTEGAMLGTACKTAGNPCNKATVLGTCINAHCATECMPAPVCM